MKNAYFITLESIINIDNKVWVIDKNNPKIPILKVSTDDFKLFRIGLFNNKLTFNGRTYYISDDLLNKIILKCKATNTNINNISFSMQEFTNQNVVKELDYNIDTLNLSFIKNNLNDKYLIVPYFNDFSHKKLLENIQKDLQKKGIKFKDILYTSANFNNSYNKKYENIKNRIKLLLQFVVGYKSSRNKFINEEITNYDNIYYFDVDFNIIETCINEIPKLLNSMLKYTDKGLLNSIKDDLKENKTSIYINYLTNNSLSPIKTKKVSLVKNSIENYKLLIEKKVL